MEKVRAELDEAKLATLREALAPGFAAGLVPDGVSDEELATYIAGGIAESDAPFYFNAGFASGLKFSLFAGNDIGIGEYAERAFAAHATMRIMASMSAAIAAEEADSDD